MYLEYGKGLKHLRFYLFFPNALCSVEIDLFSGVFGNSNKWNTETRRFILSEISMQAIWTCSPEWIAFAEEGRIFVWQEKILGNYRNIWRSFWPLAGGKHLFWDMPLDLSITIHIWVATADREHVFVLRWAWPRDGDARGVREQIEGRWAGKHALWEALG